MIRRYRGIGVFCALASTALVASLVASGCGSTECSFTAACVGASVGGNEGGADVVMVDGGFDAPLDPCVNTPSDPKCLDETTALFVSTKADAASADGSRAHPYKTITAGLKAVSATRKRIYVCEGDYLENVSVQTSVSILGGLTCDWMGKGANPRVAPAKGVALAIVKSTGVVITDVNVEGSADPQADGDSAIAVFVSSSNGVLFRRVTVKAGAGTKGAVGADGNTSPNYSATNAVAGATTSTSTGAAAPMCGVCTDGTFSSGGKGAASGGFPTQGTAMPAVGSDNSGGTVMGNCVPGTAGAAGAAAAAAAMASTAPGALSATGWQSGVTAQKGTNGNPAQGGGGGGSNASTGGGSGGCGGCGGSAGAAGGNGGSSFAVVTFESDVTIEDSALTAAGGGSGGKGGKGQDGQFRGPLGGGACNGGDGGHGAGGGGGGGGAGGHSVAIAHSGKAPVTAGVVLKHVMGGAAGDGGGAGASMGNPGKPGGSGAAGTAADDLPL